MKRLLIPAAFVSMGIVCVIFGLAILLASPILFTAWICGGME